MTASIQLQRAPEVQYLLRIAQGESDDRIAALAESVASADPALGAYVQALLADEVKVAVGKAYIRDWPVEDQQPIN